MNLLNISIVADDLSKIDKAFAILKKSQKELDAIVDLYVTGEFEGKSDEVTAKISQVTKCVKRSISIAPVQARLSFGE